MWNPRVLSCSPHTRYTFIPPSASVLVDVRIPSYVTKLHDAYKYCINLRSIRIPDTVTDIAAYAFINCENLRTVTLPKNTTVIPAGLFSSCHRLENIRIPESVHTIRYGAFRDCKRLQNVYIPDSVEVIVQDAFHNCNGITCFSIPFSVKKMYTSAFQYCDMLTCIYIRYNSDELRIRKFSWNSNKVTFPLANIIEVNTNSVNVFDSFITTLLTLCELNGIDDGISIATDCIWPYLSDI